jgi:hypothetical protein
MIYKANHLVNTNGHFDAVIVNYVIDTVTTMTLVERDIFSMKISENYFLSINATIGPVRWKIF